VVALFAVCHRDERIIEYAEVRGTQQSDLARPQRIQEAETVAMGRLIAVVSPEYPEEAKQQHSTGKVVLKILIDTAGQVKEASLLTGGSAAGGGYRDRGEAVEIFVFLTEPGTSRGRNHGDSRIYG